MFSKFFKIYQFICDLLNTKFIFRGFVAKRFYD